MALAFLNFIGRDDPLVARFRSGRQTGIKLAESISERADRHISAILGKGAYAFPEGSLSLIATGGYGRRELFPYSDLDLVFLVREHSGMFDKAAKELVYALWDLKVDVGYSIRDKRESFALALKDLKVFTSLLDSRLVFGSQDLFFDFQKEFIREAVLKRGVALVEDLRKRREKRRETLGDSVYFLEPDIKEGRGGLRDYNTSLWIAKACFGSKGFVELVGREILKKSTITGLYKAADFIFDVRHRLKLLSSSKSDRLTFEIQDRIAAEKGLKGRDGTPDAEKLMRGYYGSAHTVESFCDLMIEKAYAWNEEQSSKKTAVVRRIDCVFGRTDVHLKLLSGKRLLHDRANLVRAFALADRYGVSLHEYLKESILDYHTRHKNMPWDARSGKIFRQILRNGRDVYKALSMMHKLHALEGIIPEYGRIRARMQRDIYHRYTVDKHSLMAVREIEGMFREGMARDRHLHEELMQSLKPADREVLYLAALLHDIGKGGRGDHSVSGKKIAARVAKRLCLGGKAGSTVEFLVREHLLMSITAQRRNLDDPVMINKFVARVGDVRNLKLLYLLSIADIRSVAHGGIELTPWKSQLLSELYRKSLELFSMGSFKRWVFTRDVSEFKRRLLETARDKEERRGLRSFLKSMPEGYFRSFTQSDIKSHFSMIGDIQSRKYILDTAVIPEVYASRVTVITKDSPGLFAVLAGSFAASKINILNCLIFSSDSGYAVDTFVVQGMDARPLGEDDPRLNDFERYFSSSIDSRDEFRARIGQKFKPRGSILERGLPLVKPQIDFDLKSSRHFSILEIYAPDRMGLLYDISALLSSLKVDIHFAKISTEGNRAQDIFYLTDLAKKKISDRERLTAIRESLLKIL